MRTHLNRWIAAAAVGVVAFAAMPAQAGADLSIGVTLGAPYYYEPAPRYYERVYYEEPAYYSYYEPRVVYERHYCHEHRVYHRGGHVHGHYKHKHRHRHHHRH